MCKGLYGVVIRALQEYYLPLVFVFAGMIETAMQARPEISIGIRTVFFLPILQMNVQFINQWLRVSLGLSKSLKK